MSQKFPSILNSELAVQVLQQIAQSNPGNYSTRIAQELDTPQSSISRVIRKLSELGFTEKGKRGKAQYYEADYQGIAEFWFQKIESELESRGREKDIQLLHENEEKIKQTNKHNIHEKNASKSQNTGQNPAKHNLRRISLLTRHYCH